MYSKTYFLDNFEIPIHQVKEKKRMDSGYFGQKYKTVIVALATAGLLGIGYLTLAVIKKQDLETKFEEQDKLIKDVKTSLLAKMDNTTTETKQQAKEIKLLKEKLEAKTAEVQRLEGFLKPFRSIALERFSGDEKEALMKLAEHIKTLEQQVSKYVFKPLSPDIRAQVIKQLTGLQKIYKDNNILIELTHETWTPPKYTQLCNSTGSNTGRIRTECYRTGFCNSCIS
jgi:hypothetical protein